MTEGEGTIVAIRLFIALVTIVALVGLAVRRLAVPYTVALVVVGLGVGALVPDRTFTVTPEIVLVVLLPGLVFEASYQIDLDRLRRAFGGVALLAVPGVLISAAVVAGALALGTGLPLELGFVAGAMIAATDPIAVITTFRRLGAPRTLAALVEGESLFNDGTGLVVFAIAIRVVSSVVTPGDAVLAFVLTIVGSTAIGAIVGYLASRVIATVDDHLLELTISLVVAYGTYLVADGLHESGVIATVVAGMILGNFGRRRGMSTKTVETLDTVWEFMAFLLTALTFLLVGMAIRLPQLVAALPAIGWAVAGAIVGRGVVIYVLLGGASRIRSSWTGHRIPIGWLHVMLWSGLRGAVAVAMALSLPLDFPQRVLLQEVTFGVVLFTLLVQGTTIGLVVRRTGIAEPAREDATEPRA